VDRRKARLVGRRIGCARLCGKGEGISNVRPLLAFLK
jgi:hypothetical protein